MSVYFGVLVECYTIIIFLIFSCFVETCINCATVTFSITTATVIQCKSVLACMLQNPSQSRARSYTHAHTHIKTRCAVKDAYSFINICGMTHQPTLFYERVQNNELYRASIWALTIPRIVELTIEERENLFMFIAHWPLTINHIQTIQGNIISCFFLIFFFLLWLERNYFANLMRTIIISGSIEKCWMLLVTFRLVLYGEIIIGLAR